MAQFPLAPLVRGLLFRPCTSLRWARYCGTVLPPQYDVSLKSTLGRCRPSSHGVVNGVSGIHRSTATPLHRATALESGFPIIIRVHPWPILFLETFPRLGHRRIGHGCTRIHTDRNRI